VVVVAAAARRRRRQRQQAAAAVAVGGGGGGGSSSSDDVVVVTIVGYVLWCSLFPMALKFATCADTPVNRLLSELALTFYRDADPRLADIFVKKGAFLKMYTDYIREFESMVSLLDDTRRRNPDFDKIVSDFEVPFELAVNF